MAESADRVAIAFDPAQIRKAQDRNPFVKISDIVYDILSEAILSSTIAPGIINTKVSDEPAADNAYLYNLDGSQQAMSITIKSFATGLSGKLQSGDIVSVVTPDFKKQGQTVIPPELKYVEVISVTASSGYDANTGEAPSEDDERELPSTVTLLVSPEQSRVLAELEADGKLHLTLVYRGSRENADRFLAVQNEVIAKMYPPEPAGEDSSSDSAQPDSTETEDAEVPDAGSTDESEAS